LRFIKLIFERVGCFLLQKIIDVIVLCLHGEISYAVRIYVGHRVLSPKSLITLIPLDIEKRRIREDGVVTPKNPALVNWNGYGLWAFTDYWK